jgi:tetratricopeptide (TPR) repeat protein
VGIDTAFITIPGHIFVAFTTTLTPEQASAALIPESEYIAYQGKVWIPVEITMRHQGFLKAWELGAKEWNENNPTGLAGFYPVQEAWRVFPPVGLPGAAGEVATPPIDQVLAAYRAEAARYVDRAIYPQVQKLQSEIQASGSISAMNRLGVLYAKYGHLDRAEVEFKQTLAQRPYLPAILNLGNLYFIQDNWKEAMQYYQQALDIDPQNAHALLAIGKADQQLGKFDDLKQRYDQLKQLDPKLASEYAYLGEGASTGGRAADIATQRRAVLWEGQ